MGMDYVEKYDTLKSRLSGSARRLIELTHDPKPGSFEDALKKLDELYVTEALETRDTIFRIKQMEDMSSKSMAKVSEFVTKAFSLMEQLINKEPSKDELLFILFSELFAPKLNAEANKKLKKIWKPASEDRGDTAIGHTLTVKDLKRIMTETRDEMKWSEINDTYNRSSAEARRRGQEKKKRYHLWL